MNKLPVLTAIAVLLSACQPSGNSQSADTPAGKAASAPAMASSAGTSAAASSPVAASVVQAASAPQASGIPVVGTASVVLYDKTQCVQGYPTYCAKSNIRLPQTGIAWLDALLQKRYDEFILADNQEYDGNNGAALIRQHKEIFSKKAELTDSFELTADGLVFHYSPYEIAPFAAGAAKLTVAPDELKGILRPEYLP